MAYSFIYWPASLPRLALREGFVPDIPSTIQKAQVDSGPTRQRSRGTPVLEPLECTLIMTQRQMEIFRDFTLTTGARSFWAPYPNPNSDRAAGGLWRYARFAADNQSISKPRAVGGGLFELPLKLDFWLMVPGQNPPEGWE